MNPTLDLVLKELSESFMFRDQQIKQLVASLSDGLQWPWHCIYVHGHAATGKSMVIDTVMKKLGIAHVKVNLVECYSSRVLFEMVLQQLEHMPDLSSFSPCDNLSDFTKRLRLIINEKFKSKTVCVVIEKAERMRDMDKHIMPGILKLRELVGCQLCVILISEVTWSKLMVGHDYTNSVQIHFTEYSRQQLEELLISDLLLTVPIPSSAPYSASLYKSYVSMFLSIMYPACRNIRELTYMARENIAQFCKPIWDDELTARDIHSLWQRNQSNFQRVRNTIFLRGTTQSWHQPGNTAANSHNNNSMQTSTGDSDHRHVELPYYTKYLLIAAYLASYNPVSYDPQLFVKGSLARRSKKRVKIRKDKDNCHINGPKVFELHRLLAIFTTITEKKVAQTVYIFSQIKTLVNLRLLERCNSIEGELSNPKYKCLAKHQFVENISRQLKFELDMYLYDFS